MNRQMTLIARTRTLAIVCLSGAALFMALLLAQSAHGMGQIGLQLIFVHAPQQQVDTDGDGRRDSFSAGFAVNHDGTASGTIMLGADRKIVMQRGQVVWTSTEQIAIVDGRHYQDIHGQWQEIGSLRVEASRAVTPTTPAGGRGGGADIIVFDIVDSAAPGGLTSGDDAQPTTFEAAGTWQPEFVGGVSVAASDVDTNGDTRPDPFSADLMVLRDGTAVGTVQLDAITHVTLKRGIMRCMDGQAAVVVTGTRYQELNGLRQDMGETTVQGRPAGGSGGGDIIVFDIVDAVTASDQPISFKAVGHFSVVADPCTQ